MNKFRSMPDDEYNELFKDANKAYRMFFESAVSKEISNIEKF